MILLTIQMCVDGGNILGFLDWPQAIHEAFNNMDRAFVDDFVSY